MHTVAMLLLMVLRLHLHNLGKEVFPHFSTVASYSAWKPIQQYGWLDIVTMETDNFRNVWNSYPYSSTGHVRDSCWTGVAYVCNYLAS